MRAAKVLYQRLTADPDFQIADEPVEREINLMLLLYSDAREFCPQRTLLRQSEAQREHAFTYEERTRVAIPVDAGLEFRSH